jgi:hypothetical protein
LSSLTCVPPCKISAFRKLSKVVAYCAMQNMIYPAIVKRDLVEAVNYHWLQGVTKERFLFHTWGDAPAVRKLKRPRPRMSSAEGADSEVHGNV